MFNNTIGSICLHDTRVRIMYFPRHSSGSIYAYLVFIHGSLACHRIDDTECFQPAAEKSRGNPGRSTSSTLSSLIPPFVCLTRARRELLK